MTEKTPWNPSRRAIERVKHPLPVPTICPHCTSAVEIVNNKEVYGRQYGEWPWAYRCVDRKCDSYVGMHPFTNIPLGTLANAPIRAARKRAKAAFNPMWESAGMTRTAAYAWLAFKLGLPEGKAHIGWMDVETCNLVVALCEKEKVAQ